jgi:hypothetical protein
VSERYAELNGKRQQRQRPANPSFRSEPLHPGCFFRCFRASDLGRSRAPARSARGYAGRRTLAIGSGISNVTQQDKHRSEGLAVVA